MESLLDGRLPPRSIAWLKIQTIAVNIREDYIKRWRYPEQIYQLISQALKCEGARAAVNLLRGACAARRSEQFKNGMPTFVGAAGPPPAAQPSPARQVLAGGGL